MFKFYHPTFIYTIFFHTIIIKLSSFYNKKTINWPQGVCLSWHKWRRFAPPDKWKDKNTPLFFIRGYPTTSQRALQGELNFCG